MPARYRLHDGALLRRLMECPRPGEKAHTVRSLAAVTGLSYSKVHKLIRGTRPTCGADEAASVAHAFGLPRRALFLAISSPNEYGDDRPEETTDGPR
jgi:hypothetical protein